MAKTKEITSFDKDYYEWIAELSQRYRQSKIKAAVKVNSEMLNFYWSLGKDIVEIQRMYQAVVDNGFTSFAEA